MVAIRATILVDYKIFMKIIILHPSGKIIKNLIETNSDLKRTRWFKGSGKLLRRRENRMCLKLEKAEEKFINLWLFRHQSFISLL